jgi:hypothetical protein
MELFENDVNLKRELEEFESEFKKDEVVEV